jgi:hypothetical protein
MSGDSVPKMMQSMSLGRSPASAIAAWAASDARSLVAVAGRRRSGARGCRCAVWIHSSLVSVCGSAQTDVLLVEEADLIVGDDAIGDVGA